MSTSPDLSFRYKCYLCSNGRDLFMSPPKDFVWKWFEGNETIGPQVITRFEGTGYVRLKKLATRSVFRLGIVCQHWEKSRVLSPVFSNNLKSELMQLVSVSLLEHIIYSLESRAIDPLGLYYYLARHYSISNELNVSKPVLKSLCANYKVSEEYLYDTGLIDIVERPFWVDRIIPGLLLDLEPLVLNYYRVFAMNGYRM